MKRRSTEPGLGTGGIVPDASVSVRDRAAHELLEEIARSSSPPPSAAVPSRRTAALETPQPERIEAKLAEKADSGAHASRGVPPGVDGAAPVEARVTPAPSSHRPITRTETSPPPRGKLSSRPPITRVSDPPPGSQPPRSQRVVTTPPGSRGTPPSVGSSPPRAAKQTFRSSRPAIRVDDVGAGASKMVAPRATPKLVQGSSANLKNAKIDSKDAFVLSLIDGKLDVPGLVDVAGLPSEEVSRILERLEGLGLVKLT
ncbi:MAG: hypothetical protein JST00_10955 [Deltaproteobacteria bacterium]|nr:hypothetical protein [Deltaproteobacteria bacterium]